MATGPAGAYELDLGVVAVAEPTLDIPVGQMGTHLMIVASARDGSEY
jgi:hypothetical protein